MCESQLSDTEMVTQKVMTRSCINAGRQQKFGSLRHLEPTLYRSSCQASHWTKFWPNAGSIRAKRSNMRGRWQTHSRPPPTLGSCTGISKPANLMLTPTDQITLLDFGLATHQDVGGE